MDDTKRAFVASIEAEYRRYKALGDAALGQMSDHELNAAGPGGGNSAAVIVWHLGGNLASRFTDFLTADGEKPWRNRDEEFAERRATRAEVLEKWEAGWKVLFDALAELTDADLLRTVRIRGVELPVHAALHRSLAHASYHVGQMVYLAKGLRGDAWQSLSIPPGGSTDYNRAPDREQADAHAAQLKQAVEKG
jgi:hypothetical protein